jgi:HEAT repeat protein
MLRRRADERAHRDAERIDRCVDALCGTPGERPKVDALSDLSRAGQARLRERWLELPTQRRAEIIRTMLADAEEEVARNFERAMLIALDDPEAAIRARAIDGLWEARDPDLLGILLQRVATEPSADVRVQIVRLLGQFAMRAQLGDLPEDDAPLRSTLRSLRVSDPNLAVRVEAFESLAYLVDEPGLSELIQATYDDGNVELRGSALRGMGRQADPRWTRRVLESMLDDEPELRFEAARSAGMIGGAGFVPRLVDLARDDDDGEVRLAAIGALGEIGSEEAVRVLRELAREDDVAIVEAAEVALDVATLAEASAGPPRIA